MGLLSILFLGLSFSKCFYSLFLIRIPLSSQRVWGYLSFSLKFYLLSAEVFFCSVMLCFSKGRYFRSFFYCWLFLNEVYEITAVVLMREFFDPLIEVWRVVCITVELISDISEGTVVLFLLFFMLLNFVEMSFELKDLLF